MTILFAFGSNGSGQLGVGHKEDVREPQRCIGIPEDDPIVKVQGGGNHAVALTQSARIYIAGDDGSGMEGSTTFVPLPGQWRDFACGWSFTILVSQEGRVYGFGSGRFGELAGPTRTREPVEIEVEGADAITTVACGWRHVVAIDQQGRVFGWGWSRHGQLLHQSDDEKKVIQNPRMIPMPQRIVQVACGHVFTLLRGLDGTLYGFGSNKYKQLDDLGLSTKASWISTGWHHVAVAVASSDGSTLKCWGRNDHGQTGQGQPLQGPVDQFVCGSEHVLALQDNKVFAWGWNEHGNCASNQKSVFTPFEVPLPKGTVAVIGAGCATSWIGFEHT